MTQWQVYTSAMKGGGRSITEIAAMYEQEKTTSAVDSARTMRTLDISAFHARRRVVQIESEMEKLVAERAALIKQAEKDETQARGIRAMTKNHEEVGKQMQEESSMILAAKTSATITDDEGKEKTIELTPGERIERRLLPKSFSSKG